MCLQFQSLILTIIARAHLCSVRRTRNRRTPIVDGLLRWRAGYGEREQALESWLDEKGNRAYGQFDAYGTQLKPP